MWVTQSMASGGGGWPGALHSGGGWGQLAQGLPASSRAQTLSPGRPPGAQARLRPLPSDGAGPGSPRVLGWVRECASCI